MKSFSKQWGVILIAAGLAVFGCVKTTGLDRKHTQQTDFGTILYPNTSNHKALIYCHGGFGKVKKMDLPDIDYFVNRGWTVFVLRYGDELGNSVSIEGDVQKTLEAADSLRNDFREVDLLGISRGGFVALQTFSRYGDRFKKCIAVVSPAHMESWVETRGLSEEWQRYFKEMDDPYGYFKKMEPPDRIETGKKLMLMYGARDDVVPASQGIELAELMHCKLILLDDNHMLFFKLKNIEEAEAFLSN